MHANRQLCDKNLGGFFTAFLGVYDPASRQLTYANAGHPAPLLKRVKDGSMQALDAAGSYPLGIDQNETFNEAAAQLERGDTVLLYSDGITEARNDRGEMFEQERLCRIVREPSGAPVELIERLVAGVRAHRGAQAALDDETLVAARVL
jgi:sigma-B regulation protein RsbU (phosphoserine phosphatase)